MAEGESRPTFFRRHRIVTVTLLFLALVATYRVFGVYQLRHDCETAGRAPIVISPASLPRPDEVRRNPNIVVMTYNTEGHAALIRPTHVEQIAATIRAEAPDIVALQEVHRWSWQARFNDQAARLARLTGMKIIYTPSFTIFGGDYGNAILTRGEVVNARVVDLPGAGEPRSLLDATIRVKGKELRFVATHLAAWKGLNEKTRLEQVGCMAAQLRRSPRPFIILGDLNVEPRAEEIVSLMNETSTLFTDPQLAPTHRITQERLDYILVSKEWLVVSSRVLDAGPSDHNAVVAELTLGDKEVQ